MKCVCKSFKDIQTSQKEKNGGARKHLIEKYLFCVSFSGSMSIVGVII